jgi:hypothetical protein
VSALRIVTQPAPDSTQRVELSGSVYTLRIYWSQRAQCWHMDMSDADALPIVMGVRLVTLFPLLYRYRHLAVPPGELFVFDRRGLAGKPTLEEMGDRYRLYYVDESGF